MCGHTPDMVIYSMFHQNPLRGFGAPGGRNLPIPITLAIGFYNSLHYRTVQAVMSRACKWHFTMNCKSNHTTVLRPFFRDKPGEPVPEENFWTLWCRRRLTEADTPTIQLGATPSGLTSAHLHHPPVSQISTVQTASV